MNKMNMVQECSMANMGMCPMITNQMMCPNMNPMIMNQLMEENMDRNVTPMITVRSEEIED